MRRKWLFVILPILLIFVLFITMGVFDRFFGNRPQPVSRPPAHQEDWAPYLSTIDNDKVGAILVDLGLRTIAPISDKPNRLRVDVKMQFPSNSGLPQEAEFASLNEIEERTSSTLTTKIGAIHAGHLYCEGTMSLYYYTGDTIPFESTLVEAMSAFPNYKYEYKVDREERWESYAELLYPLPVQMQAIHNQKVVEQLRAQGDNLARKRPVDHLIYFKNESDIERFLTSIAGQGFEVVAREPTSEGEYKFTVLLRRDDAVDLQSVDDYVLYLWQKANEVGGDYDGWGSTLVKE